MSELTGDLDELIFERSLRIRAHADGYAIETHVGPGPDDYLALIVFEGLTPESLARAEAALAAEQQATTDLPPDGST